MVEYLLSLEEVNPCDQSNASLVWSSSNGHFDVTRLLLADGRVDVNARAGAALAQACEQGHTDIVEQLMKSGANAMLRDGLALINASRHGHTQCVSMLFQHQPTLNAGVQESRALRVAAESGHAGVCEILIQRPDIDPTSRNQHAIVYACGKGHV